MAQLMMHSLPRQARAMIAQKTMCHSDLVILADPDGCTRPTYKACLEFKFVFKKQNVALMLDQQYKSLNQMNRCIKL